MAILEQAFLAAQTFQPFTDLQLNQLLAKTAAMGKTGSFELFKTTSIYDGTASNPEWLGEEPKRLRDSVLTS